MGIKWAELGAVFGATLVGAVGVVVLFAIGVLGLSRQSLARERGGSGTANLAGAVVCFALCVAIVGYGLYLIVAS